MRPRKTTHNTADTNMKLICLTIGLLILTLGCTTWKSVLTDKGNETEAIHNAVYDFAHSYKKRIDNSIFFIYTTDINKDIFGISFYGTNYKVLVSTEDSITYSYRGIPAQCLEYDGRLF